MSPTTYLVSGANRGIGLELVKQLLAGNAEARVIAGARSPGSAADLLAVVEANKDRAEVIKLDLNDLEGIKAAAEEVAKLPIAAQGLDVLINNAGVFAGTFADLLAPGAVESLQENLQVNAVGTLAATLAFLPLLRLGAGKKVWTVSTMGAQFVGGFSSVGAAATYGASKAAANMLSLKLARALEPEGFTVLALHPGRVETDMGRVGAEISAAESAERSLATFASKTPAQSGTFWSYTGEALTW